MNIKDKIKEKHKNDKEQLEFIFSDEKKIVVTAPAGCGKTTAMVSKIAWELVNNKQPDHKKILAMSFSINAATKIKDSLNEILPSLVNNPTNLTKKVDVANYHNFAMKILYKSGYVLNSELSRLAEFTIVDDNNPILKELLTNEQHMIMEKLNEKVNNLNFENIEKNIFEYFKLFENILFKKNIITYNAILIAAYKLLSIESIKSFYQKFYKMIIIDEFQDTNYLAYMLITQLINENNKFIIMGDNVQKIYGFLGALPGILSSIEKKKCMQKIEFKNNYRFKDNISMKKLDKLLREYNIKHANNGLEASIKAKKLKDENTENIFIVEGIKIILNETSDNIAILVRANYMASSIIEKLNENKIEYFNALFGDRDSEYINFHKQAIDIFYKITNRKEIFNNIIAKKCLDDMKNRKFEICKDENKEYIFNSLYSLLIIMFNNVNTSCKTAKEKYDRIIFILSSNGLKRMIEFINKRVILTTIHSAKGLEWDYVIIPRMMSYSFPSSNGLCKMCNSLRNNIQGYDYCSYGFQEKINSLFEDELSIFYVAITRAKKDVFVTFNNGNDKYGKLKKKSCFLQLNGLNNEDYNWENYL